MVERQTRGAELTIATFDPFLKPRFLYSSFSSTAGSVGSSSMTAEASHPTGNGRKGAG